MDSSFTLQAGTTGTATIQVSSTDLATAISTDPEDKFPAVLATSRLVALMEIASARLLKPHLGPGQLSVGVSIDVSHTAATPPETLVTATATYTGREGKLFLFDVVAMDAGGQVGKAVHKRAIVDRERLESSAKRRLESQGTSLM